MTTNTLVKEGTTWDYKGCNTKEFTHCLHPYPAMMIPQIAKRLINTYGAVGSTLLDPYCGTGTSLVEATLYGMHGVGCDINPLARLITSAKTTTISAEKLDIYTRKFLRKSFINRVAANIPEVHSINYWFSEEIAEQLGKIRARILRIDENSIRDFFWIAFSETVRECSYTRNREFKLFRIPESDLANHTPNVHDVFKTKLMRNIVGMQSYNLHRQDTTVLVSDANTSNFQSPLRGNDFSLVVTSPPYGDSSTTVAYGQFSRLSTDWIGFPNSKKVDKESMGGTKKYEELPLSPVTSAIQEIRSHDISRAHEVESFYLDLSRSIECVASMMAEESTVCYVVGNRRVKGVILPTNEFIVHEWEKYGFMHETTFTRNIPSKRMPSVNSPSNIAGKTAHTINKEYIVVCKRTQ